MGSIVICDACNKPIPGSTAYWHCKDCEDFDICHSCKAGHPAHDIVEKMSPKPINTADPKDWESIRYRAKHLFHACDRNRNGVLDEEDFVRLANLYADKLQGSDRTQIMNAFMSIWSHLKKHADLNNDGVIDLSEYVRFHEKTLVPQQSKTLKDIARTLFQIIDHNKDSVINYEEYAIMLAVFQPRVTDVQTVHANWEKLTNGEGTLNYSGYIDAWREYYSLNSKSARSWFIESYIPDKPVRIVVTGGPGGGKTSAGDLLRREFGTKIAFVPEAATLLFEGGFPRPTCYLGKEGTFALQRAIYSVQIALEDVQKATYPDRMFLCDRGTCDGAAYWPEGPEDFFKQMGTTEEEELARYDAILFLESAAVSNLAINASMLEGGNVHRTETLSEAAVLDQKLKDVWKRHPHFYVVTSTDSFFEKMCITLEKFKQILGMIDKKDNK